MTFSNIGATSRIYTWLFGTRILFLEFGWHRMAGNLEPFGLTNLESPVVLRGSVGEAGTERSLL